MEEYLNTLKKTIDKCELLPILQGFQNKYGHLSHEFIQKLSERTGIPAGNIYGTASFYSQFRFSPVAKYHIRLCSGISCHVNNAEAIRAEVFKLTGLDDSGHTTDGKYSFELVNCLGACAQGPILEINGAFFTKVKSRDVREIIRQFN